MEYDASTPFPPTSNLSKRYGREVVNYFAGSPLNRLSFLRSNSSFLRSCLSHAFFLLLRDLDPLTISNTHLAFVPYSEIAQLLPDLFAAETDEAQADAYDSRSPQLPTVLFLGVDETGDVENSKARPLTHGKSEWKWEGYSGRPYFALDTSQFVQEGKISKEVVEDKGREWKRMRLDLSLVPNEAAILAQARTLIDWNVRNQFCASCGSRTISVQAGTKRVCPSKDIANEPDKERLPCVTRKGVHNVAFPRTDPTVIMAILNASGDKLLLGRQARWPPHFYSTLAGFIEPAESIEEAVRRETWEESGVRVGRVVVHSSQPWPYPASLMIGCIGEALPDGGETIHLGNDKELEDARWVDVEEVRAALARKQTGLDGKLPDDWKDGQIRLPPSTAIAHQLILAAVTDLQVPSKI